MVKYKRKYSTRKTTQSYSALKHNTAYYNTLHHSNLHSSLFTSTHISSSRFVGHRTHTKHCRTLHYSIILSIKLRFVTPHHSKLNYIGLDNKPHHIAPHNPALQCTKKNITVLYYTRRDETTGIDRPRDISHQNTMLCC